MTPVSVRLAVDASVTRSRRGRIRRPVCTRLAFLHALRGRGSAKRGSILAGMFDPRDSDATDQVSPLSLLLSLPLSLSLFVMHPSIGGYTRVTPSMRLGSRHSALFFPRYRMSAFRYLPGCLLDPPHSLPPSPPPVRGTRIGRTARLIYHSACVHARMRVYVSMRASGWV